MKGVAVCAALFTRTGLLLIAIGSLVSLGGAVRSSHASPFSMRDLPGVQWWISAQDSTLAVNPDGTTAAQTGDKLGYISDLSGHNNPAIMGSALLASGDSARPTLQLDPYHGKPVINFDGVSSLLSSQSVVNGATEFTFGFVVLGSSTSRAQPFIWGNNDLITNSAMIITSKPEAYFNTNTGKSLYVKGNSNYAASGADSELVLIIRGKLGGNLELWQNGVLRDSVPWTAAQGSSLKVKPSLPLMGAYNQATTANAVVPAATRSSGSLLEAFASNQFISDSDLQSLQQYLGNKWPAIQIADISPNIYVPNTGHMQGVAVGNDQRYAFHTTTIGKYDGNWNLVTTNENVFVGLPASFGGPTGHMGDGAYLAGRVFAPLEKDFGGSNKFIGVYDANIPGLPMVKYVDISAQAFEVSSITIAPDLGPHGTMFVSGGFDTVGGRKIYRYDYQDGNLNSSDFGKYLGSAEIPTAIASINGVAWNNGYLYFSAANTSTIQRVRWLGDHLDSTAEHVYKGITSVQGLDIYEGSIYLTYLSGTTTEYNAILTTSLVSNQLPEPTSITLGLTGLAFVGTFALGRKVFRSRQPRIAS